MPNEPLRAENARLRELLRHLIDHCPCQGGEIPCYEADANNIHLIGYSPCPRCGDARAFLEETPVLPALLELVRAAVAPTYHLDEQMWHQRRGQDVIVRHATSGTVLGWLDFDEDLHFIAAPALDGCRRRATFAYNDPAFPHQLRELLNSLH